MATTLATQTSVMKDRPDPSRTGQTTLRLQDTIRLSADGVAKVLGDLEARVLQTMWDLGRPASAREVHDAVVAMHSVAPLTTVTVLNKLVDKKVLTRRKVDDLYHYEPTMTEAAFRAQVSRRVMEGILSFGPEALSASLVDVLAERDPAQLEELGRLIRRRLGEQG
jgi:predicted transcriptional regulator